MNIRATFQPGETALSVHGLHQWDYGRKLEIAHPDLPAMLEVHFSVVGGREAIVRVVAGVNGVAVAPIPDELLEQSRPILAWAYFVGETSGETALTVTLPIQTRARPTVAGPVPEPISDKYTQAVAAMNEAVESLRKGDVTVSNAIKAEHAEYAAAANIAEHAVEASTADAAKNAENAEYAKKAERAGEADYASAAGIAETAIDATEADHAKSALRTAAGEWVKINASHTFSPEPGSVIQICVAVGGYDFIASLSYNVAKATRASLGAARVVINANETYNLNLVLEITAAGGVAVYGHGLDSGGFINVTPDNVYYRFI